MPDTTKFKCEGACGEKLLADGYLKKIATEQMWCWPCASDKAIVVNGFAGFIRRLPDEAEAKNFRHGFAGALERKLKFTPGRRDKYRYVGVEIETEGGLGWELTEKAMPACFSVVKGDGSLNGETGREILTLPASGPSFVKRASEAMTFLKERGWSQSSRTGMHNHVDFPNPKLDQVLRLVKLVYLVEPFIWSKFPTRKGNNYCKSTRDTFLAQEIKELNESLFGMKIYGEKDMEKAITKHQKLYRHTKGFGLNVNSIFYRGTIEFRYPNTIISVKHMTDTGLFFAGCVEIAQDKRWHDTIQEAISSSELGQLGHAGSTEKELIVSTLDKLKPPSWELLRKLNSDYFTM